MTSATFVVPAERQLSFSDVFTTYFLVYVHINQVGGINEKVLYCIILCAVLYCIALYCIVTVRLYQVGGIKEKVLAAHRAGVTRVILPKRNEKDLHEVPADVQV